MECVPTIEHRPVRHGVHAVNLLEDVRTPDRVAVRQAMRVESALQLRLVGLHPGFRHRLIPCRALAEEGRTALSRWPEIEEQGELVIETVEVGEPLEGLQLFGIVRDQ